MLKIGARQRQAFAAAQGACFEQRLVAHLLRRFPDEAAKYGEHLVATVGRHVQDASRRGIQIEHDVCRYVEYVVAYGVEYYDDPKRRPIVDDEALMGTEKMDRIDRLERLQELGDGRRG